MNSLSQRPVCFFCDQFRSASFLSEANSASFTMSVWLQEISRRAPLEQGTTQQMGGSWLLYDSAIVVEDHYILPGGTDNLQANTTLYYENTWPSPALPIPCLATFSCDVKMTKASESSHQKGSPISSNQEKRLTPLNSCLLSKDFPFLASSKINYVTNRNAGNSSHEEPQGETSLAVTG